MLTIDSLSDLISILPPSMVSRVFCDLAPLLSDLSVLPVEIVGGAV